MLLGEGSKWGEKDVKVSCLTQRLDHFDATNPSTFQQRFFYTDRYLVENAEREVIFLCVGGEGPGFTEDVLSGSDHCTGDMLEAAKRVSLKYGISVHAYALEHRYYGKSYPSFGRESPVTNKNLKYLSSRQALEDLAHFVHFINSQQNKSSEEASWITFGGSYPGFMAGNARLKYPHLIHGAVSNSAPLDLKVDFPEYQGRVAWDLRFPKIGGSETCFEIVKEGHNQAVSLVKKDPVALAKMFNICSPETALNSRENQNQLLGDGLISVYAQGNDPSCDKPLCNIEKLCDRMVSSAQNTNQTYLEILAGVSEEQNADSLVDCIDVSWQETLEYLSEPRVDFGGMRSWLWQTCTEVGFYQTSNDSSPFASFYHLIDMDMEICRVAYNITNVYDNVQATRDYYGGLDISDGSRVLSVNGNVDPWSTLGLHESPKHSLPVKMVNGASHHYWTHAVQDSDAPEVVQIREYIYSVVFEWLGFQTEKGTSNDVTPSLNNEPSPYLRSSRV